MVLEEAKPDVRSPAFPPSGQTGYFASGRMYFLYAARDFGL